MDYTDQAEVTKQDDFSSMNLMQARICKQTLSMQLEQHEKEYGRLKRLKSDKFYEFVGWVIALAIAMFVRMILNSSFVRGLNTSSMLTVFRLGISIGCIFLLARVIHLLFAAFYVKDDAMGKYRRFSDMIDDEEIAMFNMEKLVKRISARLELLEQEEDQKKEQEEKEAPKEDRLVFRWDQAGGGESADGDEGEGDSTATLEDTARLIREQLGKTD